VKPEWVRKHKRGSGPEHVRAASDGPIRNDKIDYIGYGSDAVSAKTLQRPNVLGGNQSAD
jgi:hypothetical protein